MHRNIIAVFAALCIAVPAQAQLTANDAGTIQIEILAGVQLTTTIGVVDFGAHFTNAGTVLSSDLPAHLEWAWVAPGGSISDLAFSFTLPTAMDGGGTSVPLDYGAQSGKFQEGASVPVLFNPALGYTALGVAAEATGTVKLGSGAGAESFWASVSAGNGVAGVATATVILQVDVL